MSSLSTVKVWCLPPPFSCISTTSTLSEGMVNLSKTKTVRPSFFSRDGRYIVVSTQWEYHLFLDGGTFHHLLVHNLECHKIHFIRYVGPVPDLCMKVQQPVMGVKTAQQILDAERLAPDMLDVPFVVLVDGLRNEIYQFRRLAAEFLQVNVKGVVGTVHFASVMDEILHLDVQ